MPLAQQLLPQVGRRVDEQVAAGQAQGQPAARALVAGIVARAHRAAAADGRHADAGARAQKDHAAGDVAADGQAGHAGQARRRRAAEISDGVRVYQLRASSIGVRELDEPPQQVARRRRSRSACGRALGGVLRRRAPRRRPSSPPAALSTTMSRAGPCSPASTLRTIAALSAGPATRIASSGVGVQAEILRCESRARARRRRRLPSRAWRRRASLRRGRRSPLTTSARSTPSSRSAAASSGRSSGRPAPSSWCDAPAGFDSGPSMLKIVRTPSFFRTAATCRMAGCISGAKQKQTPSSSRHRSTCGIVGLDVHAQLGEHVGRAAAAGHAAVAVLGHRHAGRGDDQRGGRADVEQLAAAAAGAAGVEQPRRGGCEWASCGPAWPRAAPATSSAVSPLAASAVRNSPICPSSHAPDMMRVHRGGHRVAVEVLAGGDAAEQADEGVGHGRAR